MTATTTYQGRELLAASRVEGEYAESWYAVHTRAHHERHVAQLLKDKGLTTFLPLVTELRRWSDRWKSVESVLFGCYVFVKIAGGNNNEDRVRVLRTDSVFDFVGVPGQGTPIPDEQIESIRTIVQQRVECQLHPFLKIGQRVRIRNGALNGVEGILVDRNKGNILVISLSLLQRSLAIPIDGYSLEPV